MNPHVQERRLSGYLLIVCSDQHPASEAIDDLVSHYPNLEVRTMSIDDARFNPFQLQMGAVTAEAVLTSKDQEEKVRALCAEMADVIAHPLIPMQSTERRVG